jgi:hypothetical protein
MWFVMLQLAMSRAHYSSDQESAANWNMRRTAFESSSTTVKLPKCACNVSGHLLAVPHPLLRISRNGNIYEIGYLAAKKNI